MSSTKIYSYLGFARNSGNVISGHTGCEHAIRRGKAKITVVAADAAQSTKSLFASLSRELRVPYIEFGEKHLLGKSIGKPDRSVVCVLDLSLAKAIMQAKSSEEVSNVRE